MNNFNEKKVIEIKPYKTIKWNEILGIILALFVLFESLYLLLKNHNNSF